MLCSACGYENRVGHRFCGMCGTPLPHRPLTAPGAQGTHSFTRVPLESAKSAEPAPARTPPEETSKPGAPGHTGMLVEMSNSGSRGPATSETSVPAAAAMVPEVPLDDYVRSFRYVPPIDSKEIIRSGEVEALPPEPVATDASAKFLSETATAGNPIPSATAEEDIGERLGLQDLPPADERHDRPRFLDFSEPTPPLEAPSGGGSNIVGPSFLGLTDKPRVAVETAQAPPSESSRGSGWTWLAGAALLAFAGLGVLEWRSQVNQTNDGPVEIVKTKLQDLMSGYSSPAQSADSADANSAKPVTQAEEQPKSPPVDQNVPTNPNPPGATSTSTPAAAYGANPATGARPSQRNTTPLVETPVPRGQQTAASAPNSSVNGTQAAAAPKAVSPNPTPVAAKSAPARAAADVPQPAVEKPKPKPQVAQEDAQEIPVKKLVPGAVEMVKADNASDSAAAAAWLWKAVARGNPDAPVRLADMYIKGDGVPRSCEQALVLLHAAAAKGDARASNRLTAMRNNGTCVQRDR